MYVFYFYNQFFYYNKRNNVGRKMWGGFFLRQKIKNEKTKTQFPLTCPTLNPTLRPTLRPTLSHLLLYIIDYRYI